MNTPLKRLLSAGGITVLAAGYALLGGNGEEPIKEPQQKPASANIEYANAKVGDEITLLRTENAKTFKAANGKRVMRLHQTKQHYLDPEDGKYKEYDLSIKEVTPEAKADPKRKWDKYVDPGEDAPKTGWFDGEPWNYTFVDPSGDNYVSFEALYNTDLVTHELKYNNFGTDLFIIINDKADANDLNNELSWKLDSNADIVIEQDGSLVIVNSDIIIKSPWAKDAANRTIPIIVQLNGDTLTYAISISETTAFPITVDPSTAAATAVDTDAVSGIVSGNSAASYADAHDQATGAGGASATIIYVGQTFGAPNYYVYRSLVRFSTNFIGSHATIDSVKYRVQYKTDNNALGNLWVKLVAANDSVNAGYLNADHYNEFKGWVAGTNPYTATIMSDSIDVEAASVTDTLAFKFNSTGISELNLTGTTQFFIVAGRDMGRQTPTGSEYAEFDDDNSYLQVYYTAPSNVVYAVLGGGTQAASVQYSPGSGGGSRDTLEASAASNNILRIGQDLTGAIYTNYRTHMSFPLTSSVFTNFASIDTCFLYLWFTSDHSTADFNITFIKSTKYGTVTEGWFDELSGWTAATLYYPDTLLVSPFVNTSGLVLNAYTEFAFGDSGLAHVTSLIGDSLHIVGMSLEDINQDEPAGSEYLDGATFISNGTQPYIYLAGTYKSPTGFAMTAANDDSIVCTWNDILENEDGYRIIQSPYSGPSDYVDSVGAGVETITISGLTPNTLYTWKVQVIHDDFATVSDEDTEYTLANLPSLTAYSLVDSTHKVFIDTTSTSNPSTTNYALKDSNSGLFVVPVAGGLDTLRRTVSWNALSVWRAAGDSLEVYLRYIKQDGDPDSTIIGHTLNFQVNAKTDG